MNNPSILRHVLLLFFSLAFLGDGFGQVVIYSNDFGITAITGTTYTGSPSVDSHISTSQWSRIGNNSVDGFISFGGSSGQALSFSNSSGTTSMVLTLSIEAGYSLDIESYNFWRRRSSSGAQDWSLSIDGNSVGSGSVPTTGASITEQVVSGGINGLTGTVEIILTVSGASGTGTFRLDDFELFGSTTQIASNTTVQFSSAIFSEDENITTADLCVDITNEDANPTIVEVALFSGTGLYIPSFTPQTLTFPTSSSAQQCATISWADNITCDGNETYTFELQNVIGGDAATIGAQNTAELTIEDDEQSNGTIAYQGFEGNGWGYTPTPSSYNVSDDIWDVVNSIENISSPSEGLNFWGIRDLDNSNGGGNFDHEIEFSDFSISGYTNVSIEFDYYTFGFDAGDDLQYKVALNGGSYGTTINLLNNTNNWVTETIGIPDGTNSVKLMLIGNQNGADDYAGFDNIKLIGIGCSSCDEPTSDATFDLNTPTFLTETEATFNWTSGDGANNLLVLKEGSAITTDPIDGTTYSANPSFGSGDDIGTDEYAVYSGSDETVALTNLTPGAEYFAKIFEYNCLPGSEDYFTSGAPDIDVFITPPENPETFVEGCVGGTSIDLSWTAPANGNYDGYLLVAREGALPNSVNSLDPSTQTFDLDYSSAPTFGTLPNLSRVIYNGTGLSANVSGLDNGLNYTFQVFAYTIGSSGYKYSSGTSTSQTIELANVTSLSAIPSATAVELAWSIDLTCADEVIVVAFDGGGVTSVPSGPGYIVSSNAYTDGANPTLLGGEKVVYSGLGLTTTITALTTEQEYCFKVFIRKGARWSTGTELCETPRSITILEPGDISIVAVNTGNSSGNDEICFFSYKSITTGTTIDFTDNGYERASPGLWGDTEGVIRIERTGPLIPAGTTICLQGYDFPSNFNLNTCGIDLGGWTITSLNGSSQFNLNGTDQIWILQGGNWNNPPGSHNATYSGNVIYGWTAIGWEPSSGYENTSGSTLYPSSECFNTDLQLGGDKVKYTGPSSETSRVDWILRVNDDDNWTVYTDNTEYDNGLPDYWGACEVFDIGSTIWTNGLWTGDYDTDWFQCRNWQNLTVPNETVTATINSLTNQPVISLPGAECSNLILNAGASLTLDDASSEFSIGGDLYLAGSLVNTNGNIVFNGNSNQTITDSLGSIKSLNFNSITVNKSGGQLITEEHISINQTAVFTNGMVIPGPSTDIVFELNASSSGASNASYVAGKVQKVANTSTDFTFPIGDSNADGDFYQPARIFDLSAGTSTFEAQYFAEANPFAGAYYDGESNSTNDNHQIGNCDYWTFNKISGTGDAKLALTYTNDNPEYCNEVGDPLLMRIASLNPSDEWDLTDSGESGDEIVMGVPIETASTGGTYGDFAFYSTGGANLNVLPIELLSFSAEAHKNTVVTKWTTSTETNNDYFTVERSPDARSFMPIANIDGAGTSHASRHYSFVDDGPLPGVSYYRLKQTDFDGVFSYSDVKAVNFDGEDGFELELVYRDESTLNLVYKSSSPYIQVEVFDVLGTLVHTEITENYGGQSRLNPNLNRGAYIVRISANGNSDTGKMVW